MCASRVRPLIPLALLAVCSCSRTVSFSPDGRRLAYSCRGDIRILDVKSRRSSSLVFEGSDPCWSPDGRYVVYLAPEIKGRSKESATLLDLTADPTMPEATIAIGVGVRPPYAWRDDGARVAGMRHSESGNELVVLAAPDGAPVSSVRLPKQIQSPGTFTWMPDTDTLAFVAGGNVWVADSGEVHKLTNSGAVVGLGVAPDRHLLLWATTLPARRAIAVYNGSLSVTPRRVAVARTPSAPAAYQRWGPPEVLSVIFSPTGRHLAVVGQVQTGHRTPTAAENREIRRAMREYRKMVKKEGPAAARRAISEWASVSAREAAVEAQLTAIVVRRSVLSCWVMGPDGSKVREVCRTQVANGLADDVGITAAWSPDGRRAAFMYTCESGTELVVTDSEGRPAGATIKL